MKMVGKLNLEFTFSPTTKGAKFTWRSWGGRVHVGNAGEFSEAVAKAMHGLDPVKDACTSWEKGADIPEFNASVKSAKASLTKKPLADTFEESLRIYMQNVAATSFWYVAIDGELVTIYKLSAVKFEKFLRKFSKLNERGVIRIANTSTAMLAWLNTNA